jgi:hypothetical protein
MKLVSQALSEKKLSVEQLPSNLQSEIEDLRNMILKYNEACDEYDALEEDERDLETERNLDSMEDSIAEVEKDLAFEIRSLNTQPSGEQKSTLQPSGEQKPTEEKKEKSSLGWLLLAGVVGVVTLGVVSLRNK